VWARVLQRPEKLLSLHSLLWAFIAAGLALLLYVLVLIPFTPGIRDIRKAKTEQPAQLVAADGKLLAEYRWVNRTWVPLRNRTAGGGRADRHRGPPLLQALGPGLAPHGVGAAWP